MSPSFLLALLIGGIYGVVFHLWRGRTHKDLGYYFMAGILGFGLGQILANLVGLQIFLIGSLHILEASLASWLALFLARWLRF